MFEYKAVLK